MKTLMSETKWCRFEPSDDLLNPYLQIVTHKNRPVLAEVLNPNRIRRSLSALLNSKKVDPLIDDDPSFINTLENFESTHVQQQASSKAPNKNYRPFSSLRQGRDPRTKTRRPFLTYEGAPMTKAERKKFEHKACHMKVMTERVQNYNKVHFVPKSKQTGTDAPLPPSSLNEEEFTKLKKTAEFAGAPVADSSTPDEPEVKMPSKIMENLQDSNCREIIRGMSVHEQMKLIHNIMENEAFKKEQRIKERELDEQKKKEAEEKIKLVEQEQLLSDEFRGDDCIRQQGDAVELERLRQQEQEHAKEKQENKKENKIDKHEKTDVKPKKKKQEATLQKGKWRKAEEYIPESQRSSRVLPSKSENSDEESSVGEAKFYNRESFGNLDDAKILKVPKLDLTRSNKSESKKKEESTLKAGKWQKAEPVVKQSKEDQQMLDEYADLKRKRYERELQVVKKCAEGNGLISPAREPNIGNHAHPLDQ